MKLESLVIYKQHSSYRLPSNVIKVAKNIQLAKSTLCGFRSKCLISTETELWHRDIMPSISAECAVT